MASFDAIDFNHSFAEPRGQAEDQIILEELF